MKRYTVTIPDELLVKMDRERRKHDVSRSEIARRALRAYFENRGLMPVSARKSVDFSPVRSAETLEHKPRDPEEEQA
jgi:hypothetical protein